MPEKGWDGRNDEGIIERRNKKSESSGVTGGRKDGGYKKTTLRPPSGGDQPQNPNSHVVADWG